MHAYNPSSIWETETEGHFLEVSIGYSIETMSKE